MKPKILGAANMKKIGLAWLCFITDMKIELGIHLVNLKQRVNIRMNDRIAL